MKVIPYSEARLNLHLKELKETLNEAKDVKEKYWHLMNSEEKETLIESLKLIGDNLDLLHNTLLRMSKNG